MIEQTFKTAQGSVKLAFTWINKRGIVVKCLGVSELDHPYIFEMAYNHILVPVKGSRLGLPFEEGQGPEWLKCSAAVQLALDMVDWGVVKVMLLDNFCQQFEIYSKELDEEVQKLAQLKRHQLHIRGTLDRLLEERNITEALDLMNNFHTLS